MAPPRGLLAAVVALLVAGTILAALERDPWDPDETRYLQITREMLDSGNPWLLTIGGESYADKPPLHFWALAVPVALLGEQSALAGMIPSLLFLFATGMATRWLGSAAGLTDSASSWGGLMFISALLPAVAGGGCRMDLMFACWCALALCQLAHLATDDDNPRRAHLVLWVWIGVGVLTKGPLAVALPVLSAAVLTSIGARGLLRRLLRGWGPLIALAIVAVWLIPAAVMAGPSWFRTIVIDQSAGRVLSSFAHREPWWYHLATVPLTLMPWSPLALGALVAAFARRAQAHRRTPLLAVYAIVGLALFSLLSGKTFLYPMVLFPPLCLLAARWLESSPTGRAQRLGLAGGGVMAVIIGLGLSLAVAPRPDFQLSSISTLVLGGSLVMPGAVTAVAALAGRARAGTAALCLAVPLFSAFGLQTLIRPFNELLSLRPFGAAYNRVYTSAGPGLAYGKVQPGFLLFTGRPFRLLDQPHELEAALASGKIVAVNIKQARTLVEEHGLRWRVADEVPYRHTRFLLLVSED